MLFKWTFIRKSELAALRQKAEAADRALPSMRLLNEIGNNPAARREFLFLLKDMKPSLSIPELENAT